MRVVYETDTRGKAKNQRSYRKPLNGKIVFNQGIIFFTTYILNYFVILYSVEFLLKITLISVIVVI